MHHSIREVMSPNPQTLPQTATVMEAAQSMRRHDIGDVVVMDDGRLCGILTDRDIVVRALAEGKDPARTKVGDICSRELITVSADRSVGEAVRLMREHAIRRLPVEERGRIIGMLSLGDLALDIDRRSALAEISAAPPNA